MENGEKGKDKKREKEKKYCKRSETVRLCKKKWSDGRALAGQAGRIVIGRRRIVRLVRKNAWREIAGEAEGDISRKFSFRWS